MSAGSLMFDDASVNTESGEDAFRRIASRKLRERGCPEAEIDSSVERLLAKQVGLEFSEVIEK